MNAQKTKKPGTLNTGFFISCLFVFIPHEHLTRVLGNG